MSGGDTSPEQVIARVLKQAEDDAYLHGAWNSRPDPQPEDIIDALQAAGFEVNAAGELPATKALLEATRQQLSSFVADFCALRDALPREQVERILTAVGDVRGENQ